MVRLEQILNKITDTTYILVLDEVSGAITDINYDIGTGYTICDRSSFYATEDIAMTIDTSKNIIEQLLARSIMIYCYLPLSINTGINSTVRACKEITHDNSHINIIIITVFILILLMMIIWMIYSNVMVVSKSPST